MSGDDGLRPRLRPDCEPAEPGFVAKLEAAASGDKGLREAIGKRLYLNTAPRRNGHWLAGEVLEEADHILALPEIAELRAKAAAADRARELANKLVAEGVASLNGSPNVQMVGSHLIACGNRIAHTLDGTDA